MTFEKPDTGYWERKFIAYMHDPLDKVLQIPGHEERAAQFLDKYGLQKPNEEFWKKADAIAAGFERGQVPSYSSDPNRNGAVDFMKHPIITHPTSAKAQLRIVLPDAEEGGLEYINEKLLEFIEKEIGMKPGRGGYSDRFKGDEDLFAIARFLYTHLILRFRLAENNVGGLGAFWHRIPADSRFPDHSIWQHNALCSAIYSSIELGGSSSELGLMVFSITPVQEFIAKARKLRDYWTGSVLLSWLSFEGMRWVIENLGPDHILYPSLIDQPLVNEYVRKKWKVAEQSNLNPPRDIASLPNKFLFLIPMNMAGPIAEEIKKCILAEWVKLCQKVRNTSIDMLGELLSQEEQEFIGQLFKRQTNRFWDFHWTASHLISASDHKEIERLLPEVVYIGNFETLSTMMRIIEDKDHYDKSGRGILYSVSHSLVQTALAASKAHKTVRRLPENGEKCHLCGQFEVLHHIKYVERIGAKKYKENARAFWADLKKVWDGDEERTLRYNLNENEMLCSICLTKRMACYALEKDKDHILHNILGGKGRFPSTTEVSLATMFERENIPPEEGLKIAQRIHDEPDDRMDNQDRYFAILIMDGDNMGRLVNGETLGSTWESIMHPDIVDRLRQPDFDKKYREPWKEIFENKTRRLVTPAIHAAISEALGDFSLYGVSRIIEENGGKLIYAGGDDVCAVLPVAKCLAAAREIQQYFTSTYKLITGKSDPEDLSKSWEPRPGKLSINLGKAPEISISAAILICHHKESLTQMIARAHDLLDNIAKKIKGKNACAIELRKRSGGARYFVAKWNDRAWDAFLEIGSAIKSKSKSRISSSVVYRLEQLRDGVEAILKKDEKEHRILKAFIKQQLERSEVGDKTQKEDLAKKISKIVVRDNGEGKPLYKPEGLIVAGFMAEGGRDNGMV
ncbi:MAG: type III-B CRISPR-associated protein Cas10/Cmr2 [Deltaproteobacteria bacterium]|nr:type III-B CRISPR-associated protein Cas10/Cmr2 [Deltaproteobacteria bacterium]